VVDDLDGDLACFRPGEGAALGRVEFRPRGLVDFGAQGALELVVRLVRAGEVGVAHEEALAVVVRVDEPAGDVVGAARAHLARRRVVHVQPVDLDDDSL